MTGEGFPLTGVSFIHPAMQTVLIVIHLFVAMALVAVVLLQRSEGGALGGLGGSGSGLGGMFSPRGAANTLTRTTAVLGILFFTTSLALTILSLGGRAPSSILDSAPTGAPMPQSGTAAPPTLPSATPAAPATPAPAPAVPSSR